MHPMQSHISQDLAKFVMEDTVAGLREQFKDDDKIQEIFNNFVFQPNDVNIADLKLNNNSLLSRITILHNFYTHPEGSANVKEAELQAHRKILTDNFKLLLNPKGEQQNPLEFLKKRNYSFYQYKTKDHGSLSDFLKLATLAGKDLEKIELGNSHLTDQELIDLVKHCPNIRHLNLSKSRALTENGVKALAHLKNLESLNLADNGGFNDKWLEAIAGLETLRSLNLQFARFKEGFIKTIPTLPNLEELELGKCLIDDQQLEALAHLKHLRELSFSGATFTDRGIIKTFPLLTSLEILRIGECRDVTELGIRVILTSLPNLKKCDLYGMSEAFHNEVREIMRARK